MRYHCGKGAGEGDTYHVSRITPIMEKYDKTLTTLASILLSFDLRKSEAEEREKRARSWCLLLVSNDINRYGNFKGKSRVTRCENSKSRITLLCQITPHAANLGQITHHADNLGPVTRHRKRICHPAE